MPDAAPGRPPPAIAPDGSGFFVRDLGEWTIGPEWYEGALAGDHPPPGAAAEAAGWLEPGFLDPAWARPIQDAFDAGARPEEGGIAHVCLDGPLRPDRAAALHAALEAAPFEPHHHAAYRVAVARRPGLAGGSPLAAFVDWLGTRAAASLHAWLAGRLVPDRLDVQVQVARSTAGDRFPLHEDSSRRGLAVVYNLSRGFTPEMGGVLRFTDPATGRARLAVPPRFNSVLLFEPRGAPHEVTELSPTAAGRARYTVTAFYLDGSESEPGDPAP